MLVFMIYLETPPIDAIIQRDNDGIKAWEMMLLRREAEHTKWDHKRNEDISKKLWIEAVTDYIKHYPENCRRRGENERTYISESNSRISTRQMTINMASSGDMERKLKNVTSLMHWPDFPSHLLPSIYNVG
jgi:hypothetical protein